MSSKADYLKRYASGSGDDKKKRKKKKVAVAVKASNLMIVAEEDEMPRAAVPKKSVLDWDDDHDVPLIIDDGTAMAVDGGANGVGSWDAAPAAPGGPAPTYTAAQGGAPRGHAEQSDSESPPRRGARVNDSDSDSSPRRNAASVSATAAATADDSDSDSPPRRGRRRERSDSSSSSSSGGPRRRARYDSESDSDSDGSLERRPKADATSATAAPSSGAAALVEGDRPAKVKAKLSSGHDAGLQSGKEFGVKERAYRAAQDAEMRRADPTLSGANAETVYRDKKGQKLDMLNEFMRKQAADESKEAKLKEAAELYGKGTAQQEGGSARSGTHRQYGGRELHAIRRRRRTGGGGQGHHSRRGPYGGVFHKEECGQAAGRGRQSWAACEAAVQGPNATTQQVQDPPRLPLGWSGSLQWLGKESAAGVAESHPNVIVERDCPPPPPRPDVFTFASIMFFLI